MGNPPANAVRCRKRKKSLYHVLGGGTLAAKIRPVLPTTRDLKNEYTDNREGLHFSPGAPEVALNYAGRLDFRLLTFRL